MKKYLVLLVILLSMVLAGCQTPQPGYYEQLTATVNEGADKILEALEVSEAVPPDRMAVLNESIETLQTTAIESAKAYDQADDQIGGWLKVGEIVAGVFNPQIALLVGTAGFGYAKYKSGKLAISDKKYQAHKKAGERIMRSSEPLAPNEVYAMIGEERQKVGL